MGSVSSDVTYSFDGVTSFKVGLDAYKWGSNFLQYVEFDSQTVSKVDVSINFTNSWRIDILALSGNMRVVIKDKDAAAGRNLSILDLSQTKGTNVVELKSTSISHLFGGEGAEQVTLGNGSFQSIQLGDGNNVLKTGAASMETISTGAGDDKITFGSGYVVSLIAGSGDNTVTVGTGEVEFLFTGRDTDTVSTSTGYVGLIDTGRGQDIVKLGSGGAGSVVLSRDADTVVLSKLVEPGTVTLSAGENVSDSTQKDSDTIDFSKFSADFTIDLKNGFTVETGDGDFVLYGFENAVGGSGDEVFRGNADANSFDGNGGADRLSGGLGADLLSGGTGKDIFIFDTKPAAANVDKIDDFSVADDTIWLDEDIFTKAGKVGDLASGAFYAGTKAHDGSDRIIYDKSSGKLFYDADGDDGGAAVQIALLTKGLAITAADFDIIA